MEEHDPLGSCNRLSKGCWNARWNRSCSYGIHVKQSSALSTNVVQNICGVTPARSIGPMHMQTLHRVGSARGASSQPCMSLFSLHLRCSGTLAIGVRLTCGRPQVIASVPGSSSDGWRTRTPRPRGSHDDSSSLEHGSRDTYTGSTHFIIHSCFSGSKNDRLRPQKGPGPSSF